MYQPLTQQDEAIRVFQCPICNEYMNTTQKACSYCANSVDPALAERLAALETQVSWACHEASLISRLVYLLPIGLVARFLPYIGPLAGRCLALLLVGLMAGLIHWYFAYASLTTAEPEYLLAARRFRVGVMVWSASLLVWVGLLAVEASLRA